MKKRFAILFFAAALGVIPGGLLAAQEEGGEGPGIEGPAAEDTGANIPFVDITVRSPEDNREVALSIQILLLLAVITLAPSIVLLMTSFLRIAIVFDFIKRALSLQQVPPNQVLMGIALFLTLFIMWPSFQEIYEDAYRPFADNEIGIEEMYERAEKPIRIFMYRQMQGDADNIRLFMNMRNLPRPNNLSEVPTFVLIPAFVLHELTVAFKIGILLFIPFIIIDMVVASTLMSMGMIMLPPVMISLPFKIMLFVLVDGWGLLTRQIVQSFL
jgi:flagellar biosynthesis protein FliP